MKVKQLFEYPVKGLRGNSLCCAGVNKRGLAMDRRWMLADEEGDFISQRQSALLTQFLPSYRDELSIRHLPTGEEISVDVAAFTDKVDVQVWGSHFTAHTINNEVNQWFSDLLKQQVRLVYMDEYDIRKVKDTLYDEIVSFADGYPVHLVTESSLADLNSRMTESITAEPFRPNIVIDGAEPFAEDGWTRIRIGAIVFKVAKKCARCHVINIDQQTGEASVEPLKTLSTYRKEGNKVNFGVNLIPETTGIIHENDEVVVLT